MNEALSPGAVIGILGGGQLGRMLSVAAARLGFKTCIFDPAGDPPASHVANFHFRADYNDEEALTRFAASVQVITFEFENIPTDALDILEPLCPVRPGREALRVSQDRLTEKAFLSGLGLRTAPYADIRDMSDLSAAHERFGPSILKTRRLGYDGKGQVRVSSDDALHAALDAIKNAPAILEGKVDFEREVSVIGARGIDGSVACFDPGENIHRDGILRKTSIPAQLTAAQRTDAVLLTGRILNALDYVGVMGVELFVTPGGLIVNEIAPRVHNSGHWTQQGCQIDQFEQHIRAVTGLPLGDGARYADVEMQNLIGDDMDALPGLINDPGVSLHLYGKGDVRPGRKMGHINRIVKAST